MKIIRSENTNILKNTSSQIVGESFDFNMDDIQNSFLRVELKSKMLNSKGKYQSSQLRNLILSLSQVGWYQMSRFLLSWHLTSFEFLLQVSSGRWECLLQTWSSLTSAWGLSCWARGPEWPSGGQPSLGLSRPSPSGTVSRRGRPGAPARTLSPLLDWCDEQGAVLLYKPSVIISTVRVVCDDISNKCMDIVDVLKYNMVLTGSQSG